MKKMLILMLVMFIMSCFSLASAHDNPQWLSPTYQMLDGDDSPPPEPPKDRPHKHHPKPPKDNPDKNHPPEPPQPDPGPNN